MRAASLIPGRRDALLQIWIGRWVEHALVTDPLRLYDDNALHPLDHSLASGVQWVVLQRARYADGDWPVVRARAAAAFGGGAVFENEATTIFRVPDGPTAAPQFKLSAPESVRVGGDWASILEVTNPLPRWALIYIKAPVTLTVTWRDGGGQVIRRDLLNLPVAIVGPPGTIRCALDGCALDGRPRAAGRVGLPSPGRYTVDLVASGGLSASASTTVEVQVATALGPARCCRHVHALCGGPCRLRAVGPLFRLPRPGIGIGAGGAVAWLLRHGRWGRGVAYAALAYGTVTSLILWFTITIGGGRSIYP